MDRWCSVAFVLRALSAAQTTTTVDYKLGADVNRLRSDVFVLRVLRCLTLEVSWRQRCGVLDSKRKMGRRPCAWWPVRHAVGAQLDRLVRPHRVLSGGKFRTNVRTSTTPRNATSCHVFLILGRTPKTRQIAKIAATSGVYGFALTAPEKSP